VKFEKKKTSESKREKEQWGNKEKQTGV